MYVQDAVSLSYVLVQMPCQSKQAEYMQMEPLDLVESCSSVLQVWTGMWNMTCKFIAAEVSPGEGANTSRGSANSSTSQRVHKCCSSALNGMYMST